MKTSYKISMLEYAKIILSKVAFDRQLLLKEFKKSQAVLVEAERKELQRWMVNHGLLTRAHSNHPGN